MDKKVMEEKTFLFNLQPILPMCNIKMSGISIKGMPYYHKVEEWSSHYACQIGLRGSYGYDLKIYIFLRFWDKMDASFVKVFKETALVPNIEDAK